MELKNIVKNNSRQMAELKAKYYKMHNIDTPASKDIADAFNFAIVCLINQGWVE